MAFAPAMMSDDTSPAASPPMTTALTSNLRGLP